MKTINCFLVIMLFANYVTAQISDVTVDNPQEVSITVEDDTIITKGKAKVMERVPPVALGFRFMPTFSRFDIRSLEGAAVEGNFVMKVGYGGMLGVNFTKNIGMEIDIIYSEAAQKYSDRNIDRRVEIAYINIPVMLSLNTDRTAPVNLNIVGGPQLGINAGARVIGNDGDTVRAVAAAKQSDLGFVFGAGVDFGLNEKGSIRLDVGFRGVYGLLDIRDESATTATGEYLILDRTNIETYSAYFGLTFLF